MKDIPVVRYIAERKVQYVVTEQTYYLHKVDSTTQQCWWTQDMYNTVIDNLLDNDYQSFKDWTYHDWDFWLDHIRQALVVQGRIDGDRIDIIMRKG